MTCFIFQVKRHFLSTFVKLFDDLLSKNKRVEGFSLQELPKTCLNFNFSIFNTNSTSNDDNLRNSMTFHPFKDVEVASVVMRFC